MLKERFVGVITTLPSRASHPMAQSKIGVLPSTSFLSCASEISPWVLRAYQMAPPIWPMSSSMAAPISLCYLNCALTTASGGKKGDRAQPALVFLALCEPAAETDLVRSRILRAFLGKRRAGELAPEAKPSRKELGRKAGRAGTKTMLAEERKVIATKDSKA